MGRLTMRLKSSALSCIRQVSAGFTLDTEAD